jgi:hypothetical protein
LPPPHLPRRPYGEWQKHFAARGRCPFRLREGQSAQGKPSQFGKSKGGHMAKVEVEFDLKETLQLVSGYSKAGKPFGPVLSVKRTDAWNSMICAVAKAQGVPEVKVNMPKDED